MTDDALVDAAAKANQELVAKIANRQIIRTKVIDYYRRLAAYGVRLQPA
jgi:hypothetical protein